MNPKSLQPSPLLSFLLHHIRKHQAYNFGLKTSGTELQFAAVITQFKDYFATFVDHSSSVGSSLRSLMGPSRLGFKEMAPLHRNIAHHRSF